MLLFRILVVEDHDHVRRFICSVLQKRPEFLVVGEATDGLQAVSLAQELQPDLILIDIGLPKLNGLEAGKRIRHSAPDARLLFLSLECLPEIVRAALQLGALAYVHKPRAQTDLLPAIDAVLAGRQFVSADVNLDVVKQSHVRHHEVHFYSNDAVLVEGITRFIAAELKEGNPAIVLATRAHSESLVQRLKEKDIDIDGAIRRGTYIALDAAETLSRIMENGSPHLGRFTDGIISLIESAATASPTEVSRVAIFGECVGLLCSEGNMDAAIQLETTGNNLIRTRNIDILCAYPLSAFHGQDHAPAYARICSEHTAVHSR